MLCGRCSSSQLSLFTLLPSTWWAAVAAPHRNLAGKALADAVLSEFWENAFVASIDNKLFPTATPRASLAPFCINSLRFTLIDSTSADMLVIRSLHFEIVGAGPNSNYIRSMIFL